MLRRPRPSSSIAGCLVASLALAGCVTGERGPTHDGPRPSHSGGEGASADPAFATPPACTDARFVWLPPRDQLVLANCLDQGDRAGVERLWAWDGGTWELLEDEGPPGLVVPGIAYDAGRDVIVRYGGLPLDGDGCIPETWEWDGDAWREVEATPPSSCDHVKLAYHADEGVVLLAGGSDADGDLVAGTFAWDGRTWAQVAEDGPPPRAHFGFVHDELHAQTFLYGGYDRARVYDDFWSFDGERWTELDLAGPGPRSHAGVAVSPDGMLLFGGATGTSTFATLSAETWYLTDGSWRLLEGPGPSARGLPALGWDAVREVMVLYGGFAADGSELDDLWEWDGRWTCVAGCA
jgi:hypothetical protein